MRDSRRSSRSFDPTPITETVRAARAVRPGDERPRHPRRTQRRLLHMRTGLAVRRQPTRTSWTRLANKTARIVYGKPDLDTGGRNRWQSFGTGSAIHRYDIRWYPADVDFEPPHGGTPFTFRCERTENGVSCGRIKRVAFGENTGDLIYQRYVDPPGWVSYPRGDAPTIQEFRLDWIHRQIAAARAARKAEKQRRPNQGVQG